MATTYRKITEAAIPPSVRFDVPQHHVGQAIEVAYGGFGRAEHDDGAPYKRVVDHSAALNAAGRISFYALVTDEDQCGIDYWRNEGI
jgi:hypothetical protein